MNKLVSILCISLLLFNILGYYGIFCGLQYRNDKVMAQKFDADNYAEAQTVMLKIPLAVPYMNDDEGYLRVEGQFEHKGQFYRLVKQKFSRDTLTIVCFKDQEHKRISEEISRYVKTFTDKMSGQSNSKPVFNFIKDYLPQSCQVKSRTKGWVSDLVNSDFCDDLIPCFTASIIHPPERG